MKSHQSTSSRIFCTSSLPSSSSSSSFSPSLITSTRSGYLLSSYYAKTNFPHNQVQINYRIGADFRSKLLSSYFSASQKKGGNNNNSSSSEIEKEQEQRVVEWPWYGGKNPTEDIAAAITNATNNNSNNNNKEVTGVLAQPKGRKYVPLEHVFHIEFRADHLLQAGEFQDALKHFGVCVKARQTAYPAGHIEITKVMIKLARAFRLCGKPESAVANLEKCLEDIDASTDKAVAPPCEQVCEILMELGLAKRDLKSSSSSSSEDAGLLLEDVARIAEHYHDFGGSHRHIRLDTRRVKQLNLSFHSKFEYWPAGNIDRTFALVNLALIEAEDWYRNVKKDDAGVVRVLQTRSNLIDRKQFNMQFQPGKVRSWHGQNKKKRRFNTSNPTATELLAFSPSVHQIYHDYSRAHIAPLGREDEVNVAPGARHLDDGDPFRHMRAETKHRAERQQAALDFIQERDRRIFDANAYEGSEAVQERLRKQ